MNTDPNPNLYNIDEHHSFRGMVDEVKGEFSGFLATRIDLLRAEMREKSSSWKFGLPMAVAGIAFLLISLIFINVAILAVIAAGLGGNSIAWCYSALILFGFYAIIGGTIAFLGVREIKTTGIVPRHTIETLKQDQRWMQREVKTQL